MSDIVEQPEASPGMDWDTYYAHRNKLDEIRIEQSSSFDKSILTLSSGALAFSLVILDNFKTANVVIAMPCLIYSWIFFVIAIFANIASTFISSKAAEIAIAHIDRRMREQDWQGQDKNFHDDMTRILNSAAGISFAVGAICLLVFAYKNGIGP